MDYSMGLSRTLLLMLMSHFFCQMYTLDYRLMVEFHPPSMEFWNWKAFQVFWSLIYMSSCSGYDVSVIYSVLVYGERSCNIVTFFSYASSICVVHFLSVLYRVHTVCLSFGRRRWKPIFSCVLTARSIAFLLLYNRPFCWLLKRVSFRCFHMDQVTSYKSWMVFFAQVCPVFRHRCCLRYANSCARLHFLDMWPSKKE